MSGFRPSSPFELNNPNNYKIFKDQEVPIQGRKFTDPLFPPDSNSLLGKNLDGTFIDPENEKHQILNPENIEWKRSKKFLQNHNYMKEQFQWMMLNKEVFKYLIF